MHRRDLLKGLIAASACAAAPVMADPARSKQVRQPNRLPDAPCDWLQPSGFTLVKQEPLDRSAHRLAMQWAADAALLTGRDSWFIWHGPSLEEATRLVLPDMPLTRATWNSWQQHDMDYTAMQMIADRGNGRVCLQQGALWRDWAAEMLSDPSGADGRQPAMIVIDLNSLDLLLPLNDAIEPNDVWQFSHDLSLRTIRRVEELLVLTRKHDLPVVIIGSYNHDFLPVAISRYFDRVIGLGLLAEPSYRARDTVVQAKLHKDRGLQVTGRENLLIYDRAQRRYAPLSA